MTAFDALMTPLPGAVRPVVAVVQPVTPDALNGILDAIDRGFVRAILVGERRRIVDGLRALDRDARDFLIEAIADDAAAAVRGVELARTGRADILMKGHLHSDVFLKPVVDRARGLRGPRHMSHAFICYLPDATYGKPLMVTDAAMNIAPDIVVKEQILENAVDLAHALGTAHPKVAVLAAVESLNPAMPATIDAVELRRLAERGAFSDAVVEGPLAFDNAISANAARAKGIVSEVAGDPDILLVPDIEAGNILYKVMAYLCHAITPGVILGGAIPVLLTSRADSPLARTASCAVAARMVYRAHAGCAG